MTATSAAAAAYIVAGLLFVLSLAGLSRHETARAGNGYGIAGMAVALAATVALAAQSIEAAAVGLIVVAMAGGAAIGLWRGPPGAKDRLAAVLVGWNGYLSVEANAGEQTEVPADLLGLHSAEVVIGVFIGAVTLTGSIVAFLKLSARIKSNPLMLPGRNWLNLGALVAFAALTVAFVVAPSLGVLAAITVLALALGWHLVASIGGGDMPVVVSMLNSYSGWAAAASGFLLDNDLLIITGALVGSSGAYLSYIMCRAMNRSFLSVIAGGFGNEGAIASGGVEGEHREVTAEEVAEMLRDADSVIITPGYGMAVAHAQYPGAELPPPLSEEGVAGGV